MAALNEAGARQAEEALVSVIDRYLARSLAVVLKRLEGPKARRGTKWWVPTKPGAAWEVKALDPTYVVPDKLASELADDVRPVATAIARDSAHDTARRLTDGDPDDAILDDEEIARAVEKAVALILGMVDRHTREMRAAVADADRSAPDEPDTGDFADLAAKVDAAYRRGGSWLRMACRTAANALRNAVAYDQALRAGCTHAQWISRRDPRVRPSHVRADGQVRRMRQRFRVGDHLLIHPGDPAGLPQSWPVVAGCRCGLLFQRPDQQWRGAWDLTEKAARGDDSLRVGPGTLGVALAVAEALPDGPPLTPTPEGYGLPPAAPVVVTDRPLVGFRAMAVPPELVPGQRLHLPDPLVLGVLRAGALASLAVLIPAGVAVAVAADDVVVLPADAVLEVLAVAADGVRARLVVEPVPEGARVG